MPDTEATAAMDSVADILGGFSDQFSMTSISDPAENANGAATIINFNGDRPAEQEEGAEESGAVEQKEGVADTKAEEREEDIYDKALAALGEGDSQPPAIDDTLKEALKARGIEDLDSYIKDASTKQESLTAQISLYKDKAEAHDSFMERLKNLPPEIGEAIEAHGRGDDYSKALLPLINGVSAMKEAKHIDRFALVDHYFPNKFSDEQKEAIKDGTADQHLIDAHGLFREQAAAQHNARRDSYMQASKAQAEERKLIKQRTDKAVADAVAHVRADKARSVLLDKKTLDAFTSGRLIDEMFYNEDGTPNLESLALALDAKHHKMLLARAREGAETNGSAKGAAKVMSKLASGPPASGGEKRHSPAQRGEEVNDAVRNAQDQIAQLVYGVR